MLRSSRVRRLTWRVPGALASSRRRLHLVPGDARTRLVVGEEIVVEEVRPLAARELGRVEPAHVARAVEADAVAQVVGETLEDRHVPVLVGTDEVRPREGPERAGED